MLGVGYLHERRPQKDTLPPHAPLSVTGLLLERRSFTGVFVTSLDLRRAKPLKQTQPGRPQPRSVWPVTQGQFMRLTEIPGTRHRQEACTERQAGLGQRSHAGQPGHLSLFSGPSKLLGHGQTPRPSPLLTWLTRGVGASSSEALHPPAVLPTKCTARQRELGGQGRIPRVHDTPMQSQPSRRALGLWWGHPLRILGEGPTGHWASPDPLPGFCPEHPGFPGVQLAPGNAAEGSHTDRHQGPEASGDVSKRSHPTARGRGVEEPGQDSATPTKHQHLWDWVPNRRGTSRVELLPVPETLPPARGHSKGQRTPALDVRGCRAPQGRHDTGVRRPGAD